MNMLEEALRKEAEGDVEGAAHLYEQVLSDVGGLPVWAAINLGFIYWLCTDFGFVSSNGLTEEFVAHGTDRYCVIVQDARRANPDDIEVSFWAVYFDFIVAGNESAIDVLHDLVARPNAPDLLLFFPIMQGTCNSRGKCLASVQRVISTEPDTFKMRYVASVLESHVVSTPPLSPHQTEQDKDSKDDEKQAPTSE